MGVLRKIIIGSSSGGSSRNYVVTITQVPTGDKDGSNKTFTLDHAPLPETLLVFFNGQCLTEGLDYVASGSSFTLLGAAPTSLTNLLVQYGYTSLTPVDPVSSEIEIPAGVKNGVNTDFTLSRAPLAETLLVFKNGQTLTEDIDYTSSGITITFVIAPIETDNLLTKYNY